MGSMKRRRTRKTTEIEVETQEVIFTAHGTRPATAWCQQCARESAMDSPDGVARLTGVSVRAVYRWIDAGGIHFTESPGGRLLVCLLSVQQIAQQEWHPGSQATRDVRKSEA